MRPSVILALIFSVFIVPTLSFAGGQPEDPSPVQIDPKIPADLSAAKITGIDPLFVKPGSLVCVTGTGFGTVPGTVMIGGTPVQDILSWEDTAVFFRLSKFGISGASEVTIGESKSPLPLTPAPAGSITVRWAVSLEDFEKTRLKSSGDYGAGASAVFTPPLYLKGEWTKGKDGFGNAAKNNNWDNQSKVRMMPNKGGKLWIYELVISPENQSSFGNRELRFGFQDGGTPGTLSKDESDYAFILRKEWGKDDAYFTIQDPAFIPGPKERSYNPEKETILLVYPVK